MPEDHLITRIFLLRNDIVMQFQLVKKIASFVRANVQLRSLLDVR